jgi:hypothetical protein
MDGRERAMNVGSEEKKGWSGVGSKVVVARQHN